MLTAVLKFCIDHRFLVLLAAVAVAAWGGYASRTVPIDAIPNVGENQVIVLTEWPGRSPKDVEDQITYPLSVELLGVPAAKSVRGKSLFGFSFVQVTFEDGTDFYWARSRVAEQLSTAAARLPSGVAPQLGPDATALGQIFYYVLEPPPGMNLAELRSIQDYEVKYALESVEGVSEVASVGGYVRQYQVEIDPDKLRFHEITLDQVIMALKAANIDVGAKTIEQGGMEYIIRGKGFIGAGRDINETLGEIERTVVMTNEGVPVRIGDLGQVQAGPAFRRGALDLNGTEAVGGVVVMRYGENPRAVIDRIEAKLDQLEPSLRGVKVHAVYDRTELVDETVATLSTALVQQVIITIIVVVLFLLHVRTSIVVSVTLPLAVLMAFIAMQVVGLDANIMSLAGIAIAIGTMVDMGIVVSENIYRHLADWEQEGRPGGRRRRREIVGEAAREVAPAVMTAVTTTVVSFIPVFFLVGRDWRLFTPLAWTKTFSLVAALIVAVILVPALSRLLLTSWRPPRWVAMLGGLAGAVLAALTCLLVWGGWLLGLGWWALATGLLGSAALGFLAGFVILRERLRPIEQNPISRLIAAAYAPTLRFFLAHKLLFCAVPTVIVFLGLGAWWGLPVILVPVETAYSRTFGVNINDVPHYGEAKHSLPGLKNDDWIALDEGSWFYMPTLYPAASFSQAMQVLQTQDARIKEIPEVAAVLGKIGRVDSALDPAPAAMIETYVMLKPKSEWREGMTERRIWDLIVAAADMPGVTRASPLQPIEGRVVMLQSGIKAPMAIRIYGDSLDELAEASRHVAEELRRHPRVDAATVNPDIVLGKPYVEFEVDRDEAARYGMTVAMVNQVIEAALGGANVTTTVEGRERYPIQVRYRRDLRERIEELESVPVVTHAGEVVPLGRLAKMKTTWGPGVISSEDARLVAHVSFSPREGKGDLATVASVEESLRQAQAAGDLRLPPGYELEAVGSFQSQIDANRRLLWLVPLVVAINFVLVYLQFKRLPLTIAIFLSIPVSFAGGMIFLALFGVELNTAVWVGFIALFGIAVDDGVVLGTYLDQVFTRREMRSIADIRESVVDAGLKRIRPCLMTTFTTLAALVPVLLSTGRGADVARAMAVPVFGGMVFELVTLFIVPVTFCLFRELIFRATAS